MRGLCGSCCFRSCQNVAHCSGRLLVIKRSAQQAGHGDCRTGIVCIISNIPRSKVGALAPCVQQGNRVAVRCQGAALFQGCRNTFCCQNGIELLQNICKRFCKGIAVVQRFECVQLFGQRAFLLVWQIRGLYRVVQIFCRLQRSTLVSSVGVKIRIGINVAVLQMFLI